MRICKVSGCNEKHYAKGYCIKHYNQYKRYGKILERTIYDSNEIVIYEDYAEIVIYNRDKEEVARALIDIEDIDKVSKYKWCLDGKGYIYNTKVGRLHRLLMNPKDDEVIDHKNHNKFDNRRCNLRVCTKQQNSMNQSKQRRNTTSIYKGVCFNKQNRKWVVQIRINRKQKHIGYYESEEEAAIAYDKYAILHFGEFAKTNFPIENYTDYILDLGLDLNDFNINDNEQSEDDLNG